MCLYEQGTMSVTANKETFEFDPCSSVPLSSLSPDKLLAPVHNFSTL